MASLSDTIDHWKSQYKRHATTYQTGGIYMLFGPSAAGAYQKVTEQNALARATEANEAALKEISQHPTGTTLGATGTFEISKGISQWIPVLLVFIILGYIIFKD